MQKNLAKERSNDRILVLEKGEDTPKTLDFRLFDGNNRLHAVLDPQTTFWYCKYDHGVIPGPLKQHFTSFSKLYQFVEDYFKRKNVKIAKVID